MAKQLNVNLAFSADTGKAKAQIQELQSLDTLYAPRLVQELVFACFFRHKNAEKITSNFKNLNACASYFMDYQHD